MRIWHQAVKSRLKEGDMLRSEVMSDVAEELILKVDVG